MNTSTTISKEELQQNQKQSLFAVVLLSLSLVVSNSDKLPALLYLNFWKHSSKTNKL